jgi:glyoxylase-like metal-dependent hydrolase (beta-lactamase superfamily II)
LPALQAGLNAHGFSVKDVTDVLLTHIHLDHAGAAGWLARQGARIYVHPAGAPHLRNPEKLLASASRIYGDSMQTLWGDFLPVPAECLLVPQNGDEIEIGNLRFRPVDTPGHADHHFSYLFNDVCFSGDISGVRLAGTHHIRLPMPPPDLHPAKWRLSVEKLSGLPIQRIAPTHFGIFQDADWHFNALAEALDEVESWIETTMPSDPPIETLNEQFVTWSRRRSLEAGVSPELIEAYEMANPSWMSSYGIQRYWRKYRVEKIKTSTHSL